MRSARGFVGGLLIVAAVSWLGTTSAGAQGDLAKALVGRWEGEVSTRFVKANTPVILTITSVKEEGGKWVAEARSGRNPVSVEISTSGKQPALRWTGGTGTVYDVYLMDERTLVGTATLTASAAGRGEKDRPVKLEKK
jgi:hypothetical protein